MIGGDIDNCYNTGSVTGSVEDGSGFAGIVGMCGGSTSMNIGNCFTVGNVVGNSSIKAISGITTTQVTAIVNCFVIKETLINGTVATTNDLFWSSNDIGSNNYVFENGYSSEIQSAEWSSGVSACGNTWTDSRYWILSSNDLPKLVNCGANHNQ